MFKTTGFEKCIDNILNRPLMTKETVIGSDVMNEKAVGSIIGNSIKRMEDHPAEHLAEVIITPVRRIDLRHGKYEKRRVWQKSHSAAGRAYAIARTIES